MPTLTLAEKTEIYAKYATPARHAAQPNRALPHGLDTTLLEFDIDQRGLVSMALGGDDATYDRDDLRSRILIDTATGRLSLA